ncbi:hypothetical protein L1887_35392 [Cichorium endivia]|nr:hypothetical protein L1887_35392 [Cichorium endivia]
MKQQLDAAASGGGDFRRRWRSGGALETFINPIFVLKAQECSDFSVVLTEIRREFVNKSKNSYDSDFDMKVKEVDGYLEASRVKS